MDQPNNVQLAIRITFLDQFESDAPPVISGAFWQRLIAKRRAQYTPDSRLDFPSDASIEAKLSASLPRNLRSELIGYFNSILPYDRWRGERNPMTSPAEARFTALIPLIGIRVAAIRYGSLDLSIELTGVKHLVDLFDSNYDLFMMFMEAYLPPAFSASLAELDLAGGDFRFQIMPTPTFVAAFGAPPSEKSFSASSESPSSTSLTSNKAIDRLKGIWQITNFTLILPVVLSLLVLYVAAKLISDERKDLQTWRNELTSSTEMNAKAAQERVTQLEKEQAELIRLLKESSKLPERKKNEPEAPSR